MCDMWHSSRLPTRPIRQRQSRHLLWHLLCADSRRQSSHLATDKRSAVARHVAKKRQNEIHQLNVYVFRPYSSVIDSSYRTSAGVKNAQKECPPPLSANKRTHFQTETNVLLRSACFGVHLMTQTRIISKTNTGAPWPRQRYGWLSFDFRRYLFIIWQMNA